MPRSAIIDFFILTKSVFISENDGVKGETAMAGEEGVQYAVPALARGLDILETLAQHEGGLSLSELARTLDLSPSAAFRSVVVLEQRGYIVRDPVLDVYVLSLKLFELSHNRPPFRRLLDIAVPAMRLLAAEVKQSCHLSVHDNGDVLVIADVEGPGPLNLAFRLGSRWPMRETVSGRLLLAFQGPEVREAWLKAIAATKDQAKFKRELARATAQGFLRQESETFGGIIDLGFPILGLHGAVAALTISMVHELRSPVAESRIHAALAATANHITKKLGAATPAKPEETTHGKRNARGR
jgi:DNA-binding IclR family transcriptional regulator